MNDSNTTTTEDDAKAAGCCEDMKAGCGPEMAEMAQSCACASFCKEHKLVALGFCSAMLLMFLISQVGGILGIIAFIRTL